MHINYVWQVPDEDGEAHTKSVDILALITDGT